MSLVLDELEKQLENTKPEKAYLSAVVGQDLIAKYKIFEKENKGKKTKTTLQEFLSVFENENFDYFYWLSKGDTEYKTEYDKMLKTIINKPNNV